MILVRNLIMKLAEKHKMTMQSIENIVMSQFRFLKHISESSDIGIYEKRGLRLPAFGVFYYSRIKAAILTKNVWNKYEWWFKREMLYLRSATLSLTVKCLYILKTIAMQEKLIEFTDGFRHGKISEKLLSLKSFRDLRDMYSSTPAIFAQAVHWIWLMADINSPLWNYSDTVLEESDDDDKKKKKGKPMSAKKAKAFMEASKNGDLVLNDTLLACVSDYIQVSTTPQMRLIMVLQQKTDELTEALKEVVVDDSNLDMVVSMITKSDSMLNSLESAIKRVQSSQEAVSQQKFNKYAGTSKLKQIKSDGN